MTTPFGAYQPSPVYHGTRTQSIYLAMRDGVQIALDLILPADLGPQDKLPALLVQSRYWRAMELRAPFKYFMRPEDLSPAYKPMKPYLVERGYSLVILDVRGTGASTGVWQYPWQPETLADACEVIDWIIAQPWSDGRVGAYGTSYVGTTAEMLAVCGHPAVKAILPMFNHPDAYTDIAFPGGLFNDRFIMGWGQTDHDLDRQIVPQAMGRLARLLLRGVKPVAADKDRRLLRTATLEHAVNINVHETAQGVTFRDEGQHGIPITIDDMTVAQHNAQIACSPVQLGGWGSWLDAGTADAVIRRFLTFDNNRFAVIGAWNHGGELNASPYRQPQAPVDPPLKAQWGEMLRFFDAYLKGQENDLSGQKILFYYTLGEEAWHSTPVWPPQGSRPQCWYLAEEGRLSQAAPVASAGADAYTVDFEATTGAANRWWELGAVYLKSVDYPQRQEAAAHLLTYLTPPLAGDIEISGYPIVKLYITSSATDGAFYVYLEEVDENGQVTYLTEGELRAIHRKVSTETPPYTLQVPYHTYRQADALPLIPGEPAELHFGLQPISALVRSGHRLRLGLAGHDQGTFPRLPAQGTPHIRLLRSAAYPSQIELPVIER